MRLSNIEGVCRPDALKEFTHSAFVIGLKAPLVILNYITVKAMGFGPTQHRFQSFLCEKSKLYMLCRLQRRILAAYE